VPNKDNHNNAIPDKLARHWRNEAEETLTLPSALDLFWEPRTHGQNQPSKHVSISVWHPQNGAKYKQNMVTKK
jgi:hypothetical protein